MSIVIILFVAQNWELKRPMTARFYYVYTPYPHDEIREDCADREWRL